MCRKLYNVEQVVQIVGNTHLNGEGRTLLIRVNILHKNGNRVEEEEQNAQRMKNKIRHYTYDVTLCRVCVTIFEVETQQCILFFSTSSHKRHDFCNTFVEDKTCFSVT
jgi:hypothetical protein